MGGIITVAKHPHLFAAIYANKGPTDMDEWYYEQANFYGTHSNTVMRSMRKECYVDNGGNTPAYPAAGPGSPTNPFCYQRRSGIEYARNYIHVPIYLIHSSSDQLVPIDNSTDFRDEINSFGPDQTATVVVDTLVGPSCTDGDAFHCFEPDAEDVLDYLELYTLDNTHNHINIATDESKTYYWLDIEQVGGGERFTEVEATYNSAFKSITAVISDTGQLRLGFNLGSTQQATDIIPLPSLGFPENRSYLVQETGQADYEKFYTSGYFEVDLNNTGQYTLTISTNLFGPDAQAVYLPVIRKN